MYYTYQPPRKSRKSQKLSYEAWKRQVDNIIADKYLGITSDDLPDCNLRDWYDDGVSARSAASRAIRNAKEY